MPVSGKGAPVESISEELWDKTIRHQSQRNMDCLPRGSSSHEETKFGRIVIVSSTAGQRGEANVSNYAASKGGQISFTKSLAPELATFGINVNCVAPGLGRHRNERRMSSLIKRESESIIKTIPLVELATRRRDCGTNRLSVHRVGESHHGRSPQRQRRFSSVWLAVQV